MLSELQLSTAETHTSLVIPKPLINRDFLRSRISDFNNQIFLAQPLKS